MSQLEIGHPAPLFTLPDSQGRLINLKDYHGKNIVLYFYPKDNTPGCTLEGQDFRDQYTNFQNNKTEIFGISRDTVTLHQKFKQKEQFPFELLSDTDEIACQLYDVIKTKNRYGKMVRGIERSTFLIDKKGNLRHIWRNVKVDGHVAAVLMASNSL